MKLPAAYRWFNRIAGRLAPAATGGLAARLFLTPRRHPLRGRLPPPRRIERLADGELRCWGGTPTVLLLHGWSDRPESLQALVAALLADGHGVAAVVPPGHVGERPTASHPEAFARALLAAGERLGPLQAAIGHSMGGGALLAALARGLDVHCAVTIAAPSSVSGPMRRFARAAMLPARARDVFRQCVVDCVGVPEREFDVFAVAPRIRASLLLVHDEADRQVPFADLQDIREALPQASVLVTRGLGHQRILADAGVVERVRAFVAACGQPAAAARDRAVA